MFSYPFYLCVYPHVRGEAGSGVLCFNRGGSLSSLPPSWTFSLLPSAFLPICAQLRITALGRKGLQQRQPFVECRLLASAGVTDVNVPALPCPQGGHIQWGDRTPGVIPVPLIGPFCFWPCGDRCLCFNEQSLCARSLLRD